MKRIFSMARALIISVSVMLMFETDFASCNYNDKIEINDDIVTNTMFTKLVKEATIQLEQQYNEEECVYEEPPVKDGSKNDDGKNQKH